MESGLKICPDLGSGLDFRFLLKSKALSLRASFPEGKWARRKEQGSSEVELGSAWLFFTWYKALETCPRCAGLEFSLWHIKTACAETAAHTCPP